MAAKNEPASQAGTRELVITRVLDAPRRVVFRAWTQPDRLARWFGPKGFTSTVYELDVRPGGRWRARMRSPEGVDHWAQGTYREVAEPERLVFTWAWEKPESTPGREMLVTLTFAEQGAKTSLTLRQAEFETTGDRDEHVEGWNESFDRLAGYVSKAEGK